LYHSNRNRTKYKKSSVFALSGSYPHQQIMKHLSRDSHQRNKSKNLAAAKVFDDPAAILPILHGTSCAI